MNERFDDMLKALRDPVGSRRREALVTLERDWKPEAVERFCLFARNLNTGTCIELCRVLAAATTAPLVELLGHYAARGEAELRERAFEALEHVPGTRRVATLTRLLECRDPAARERACALLATSGSLAPRTDLVRRFRDENTPVVLAAMSAVQRLDCRDVTDEVIELLEHPASEVRAKTLEMLVDLAPAAEFPAGAIARRLTDDPEVHVRVAAAWALGQRPVPAGRDPLLAVLTGGDDPAVRCMAAASLAAYADEEVARALLTMSASDVNVAVALNSRRALDRMDENVVLTTCGAMLQESDPALRKETASTLGQLSFDGAKRLLLDRLSVERDPIVRAALIEALGHGGWPDAWAAVRACIQEEPVVAYAAVCALGNLLDAAHLEDFISLLAEIAAETLREAVLKRLALYGRARGLPATLREGLVPLLRDPHRNLAVLAAETAGWVADADMALVLLDLLADADDEEVVRAASGSIMRLVNGKALDLVRLAGRAHLRAVATVLGRQRSLGEKAPEMFRHLARLAVEEVEGAFEALHQAARVEPLSLAAALDEAGAAEVEVMIRAWHELPAEMKRRTPILKPNVLQSPAPRVRIAALDTLDAETGQEFLRLLVDLSMRDPDAEAREHARRALQRVVRA